VDAGAEGDGLLLPLPLLPEPWDGDEGGGTAVPVGKGADADWPGTMESLTAARLETGPPGKV